MFTFNLKSESLGTEYFLFSAEKAGAERRPLVLALDGDDQFAAVNLAAEELRESGAILPVHVVGVGYGGGYRSTKNRRARDYTPSKDRQEPSETGGAPAFLAFLEQELLPFLRLHFEFPDHDICLTGHSLGSLFGLYALLQASPSFNRYLISAPSIWWDQRSVLTLAKPKTGELPFERRAFLCVGEEDSPSMLTDLNLLQQQWSTQPPRQTTVRFKTFPNKDHYNVMSVAMTEGLQWLFS